MSAPEDGRQLGRLRAVRLSHVWVVAAFAFPAAVLASAPLGAIDLAYQVRAGDVMLATGHVLRTDVLTFTAHGVPWLNQQWLAEVALALAFRAGGWLGLALTRVVLSAVVLLFVYLACREAGADPRRAAWWTLGAAMLIAPSGFQLRAQLFGMAAFGAVVWLLAGRERRPRRLWWAVPVVLAWANLHGSFVLAPLLFALAWVQDRVGRRPAARTTLGAGLACVALTIVTPFGLRVWPYALDVATNPRIRDAVVEWRPPSFSTYPGAAFLLSAIATAVYLARRSERVGWAPLVVLVVFALIGFDAVRGVYWWFVLLPVVLVSLPTTNPRHSGRHDPASPANAVVVVVLVAVALGAFARWLPATGERPPEDMVGYAPLALTERLRTVLAPGERWFNAQAWGSWFELALPRHPVFVDARWDVVPEHVWHDYDDVSLARVDWQSVLDRWGVRVVALARTQQEALIPVISRSPGWRLVYQDADGLIFERTSG